MLAYPLGLLPYLTALVLWQAPAFAGFLLVMSRYDLPRAAFWLLPVSAGVVQAVATGQNGLWSALFLAGGLILLERRPMLAGVVLALLTFKPQIALLIGPALLVAAIPLTTPWFHDYDAVILLLPIAFLIRDAARLPLAQWEIAVLLLAWLLPAWWVPQLVEASGLAFGPLVTLAFFAMILRRALGTRQPAARP